MRQASGLLWFKLLPSSNVCAWWWYNPPLVMAGVPHIYTQSVWAQIVQECPFWWTRYPHLTEISSCWSCWPELFSVSKYTTLSTRRSPSWSMSTQPGGVPPGQQVHNQETSLLINEYTTLSTKRSSSRLTSTQLQTPPGWQGLPNLEKQDIFLKKCEKTA
ncbi:hypothetical protein PSHT_03779 [Puccinia striiformis]|uniref:Uncharacterized protein n=1 Tax=Puccinia striiformis TaxID=27350 RepID=A0A2S4WET6_9BASI|nr:hypothetical protein PSHT_03779 [Puccinia striiformis]